MKRFLKVFGAILLVFGIVIGVLLYIAGIGVSIYIIAIPWLQPEHDRATDIFVSSMGILLLFATLVCLYFSLCEWIHPRSRKPPKRSPHTREHGHKRSWDTPSRPITPTPKR